MTQTSDIISELTRVAERVIKKVTLDVTANLQAPAPLGGTPVDTGWARANWVPNITTAYRVDASTPDNIGARFAFSQQGTAQVAANYKLSMGSVFVSNNVPYILPLNDGHSKQAPAAFVQRAIAKAVTIDLRGFKP